MFRVIIGAIPAAIAMFILGFVFFGTPLSSVAIGQIDDEGAAVVQSALAETMGDDSARTVIVPSISGEVQQRLYIEGPIAMVHFNPSGSAVGDPSAMIGGFIHMLISSLLLGVALLAVAGETRDFAARLRIGILFALAASVFMHLGMPVWWHQDWAFHIYLFFTDFVMFGAAAFILARWFMPSGTDSDDRFGAEQG